jgi:Uma2 family endonuclease
MNWKSPPFRSEGLTMSNVILAPPPAETPSSNGHPLARIVIGGQTVIPAWVNDLDKFRFWAKSGAMPKRGWFAYLDGELWVDLGMEQIFSHGQPKAAIAAVLFVLVETLRLGYLLPDRTLWSHPQAGFSTEPDLLFAHWETVRSGKLRLVPSKDEGFLEVEGTPDLVVEIISKTSVRKDTVTLRELYWRAGVAEYWLVDARGAAPDLTILSHGAEGYEPAAAADGWVASAVFGKRFKLTQEADPLGHPHYRLEHQ